MVNTAEVGKETERRVVGVFRAAGWTGAERKVRTGYRVPGRTVQDQGDLTGIPGLCVQVKSLRDKRPGRDPNGPMELMIPTWLDETEAQRKASGAVLGLLVVRRWTTADAASWWCFLRLEDLHGLLTGRLGTPGAPADHLESAPVRLELRDVVAILRGQGWGANDLDEVAG